LLCCRVRQEAQIVHQAGQCILALVVVAPPQDRRGVQGQRGHRRQRRVDQPAPVTGDSDCGAEEGFGCRSPSASSPVGFTAFNSASSQGLHAWHRALREHGYAVQLWKIHRHIGMGGDQLVAALIGEEGERSDGEAIRDTEGEAYGELIGEVQAMDGATALLRELREDGAKAIFSSSAKAEEVEHYLDLLEARDLVEGWTTAADVERTKPHPDLIHVALEKAGSDGPAVMVGDSTWDVKVAEAEGILTLAVLTGGFSEEELREAGAAEVVKSIGALRKDRGALARLARSV
jgi:HAD superfamily hydrolase (TIGR01509 family)